MKSDDKEFEYKLLLADGLSEEELAKPQSKWTAVSLPPSATEKGPVQTPSVQQALVELQQQSHQDAVKRKKLQSSLMSEAEAQVAMNQIRELLENTVGLNQLQVKPILVPEDLWDVPRFSQQMLLRLAKVTPEWLRAGTVAMPVYDEAAYLSEPLDIPWYGLKFCRFTEQVSAFGTLTVELKWGYKEKKYNDWRWSNIVTEKGKTFYFLYDFSSKEWIGIRLGLRDKKSQAAQDEIPYIQLWDERQRQHEAFTTAMIPFSRHFRLLLQETETQFAHLGNSSQAKIKLYRQLQQYLDQLPLFMDILVFNGEMSDFARKANLDLVERANFVLADALSFLLSLGPDDYLFKNMYGTDPLDKKDQLDRISEVKKEYYAQLGGYTWSTGATFLDFVEEMVKPLFEKRKEAPMTELHANTVANRLAKSKGVIAVDRETNQIARTVPELERLRGRTELAWDAEDQLELDAWLLRHF